VVDFDYVLDYTDPKGNKLTNVLIGKNALGREVCYK
jgi:hypothetical protein